MQPSLQGGATPKRHQASIAPILPICDPQGDRTKSPNSSNGDVKRVKTERRALLVGPPQPSKPQFQLPRSASKRLSRPCPQSEASAKAVQGGTRYPLYSHRSAFNFHKRVSSLLCSLCSLYHYTPKTFVIETPRPLCFFTDDSCKRRVLSDVNNANVGSQLLPCSCLRQCHFFGVLVSGGAWPAVLVFQIRHQACGNTPDNTWAGLQLQHVPASPPGNGYGR